MEMTQNALDLISLAVPAILLFFCLFRLVKGPGVTDRIIAVNMMTTLVVIMIGILTCMLGEGYLADIALIYALLGFLAVVVLTRVYLGVYIKKQREAHKNA